MTRYYWDKKTEIEGLLKIYMAFLKAHHYLSNHYSSGLISWTDNWGGKKSVSISASIDAYFPKITISYTQTESSGDKKAFNYDIKLTTTPCHFGGQRYWFICPLNVQGVECHRRVGVLYKGGDYFGCRHCYKLTYQSRNQNRRSAYFALGQALESESTIEKLRERITKYTYRGKTTRKVRRLYKLYERSIPYLQKCSKMVIG